jgi:hypothetical protein
LSTEAKSRLTMYFKRLQYPYHPQIYMIHFIILNVPFCHFVCAKQSVTLFNCFKIIFWYSKLLACHNRKWIVKIPICLQHIVKYLRNKNKNILVLDMSIIFYVNLHGNPAFSLVYKKRYFIPREGDRQTNCHPLLRVAD